MLQGRSKEHTACYGQEGETMSETTPEDRQAGNPVVVQRNPIMTPKSWEWLARASAIATIGTTAIAALIYFINLEVRVGRLEAQMQATTITTALKGENGGQATSVTVNPVIQACADLGKQLAGATGVSNGYIKAAMEAMACEKMPAH